MSKIFGHSEAQSQSSNANRELINSTFTPLMNTGVKSGNAIADLLGLNGSQGQNQAFENWRNSTGYQFGLNQGLESINGNAATQGLMNSGATAKALETYGQNYANTQFGNYNNQLMGLLNGGLSAGNTVASTGNVSQSFGGGQNGGVGGMIGKGVGMLLGK
jgi:hypothetical protein